MLRKTPTGTWLPTWVPESTAVVGVLLVICSMVQSAVRNREALCFAFLHYLLTRGAYSVSFDS